LTPLQIRLKNESPNRLCESCTTNFRLSKKYQRSPFGPATGGLFFAGYQLSIQIFHQLAFQSEPAKSFSFVSLPPAWRSGDPIAMQEVNCGIKM